MCLEQEAVPVQVLLLGHSHAMSQLTLHKAGMLMHDPDL